LSEKETITFNVNSKIKELFKTTVKDKGYTMSSALVQLMKRFIEEPQIISTTLDELKERVNLTIDQAVSGIHKEFQEGLDNLSKLVEIQREKAISTQESRQRILREEILAVLKSDKKVRLMTYLLVEKAIINHYPNLKQEIKEAKERGSDPIGEAINELREQKIITYNKANKRLTWV